MTKKSVGVSAQVDIFVPAAEEYAVLVDADSTLPYSAMLNQTNLANNNNKFFLIQALEKKTSGGTAEYATWFRWGRVGYSGQTNLTIVGSREEAVEIFASKFLAKTLHAWGPKIHKSFKPVVGKYTLLSVESLTESADDVAGKPSSIQVAEVKYKPTELESPIFELIKLISSSEMFERQLKIAGVDLTRMPLGKISAPMIKQGYLVLSKLEKELLGGRRKAELVSLSNQFYTIIPHNFGFTKGMNYVIDSFEAVQEKSDLLESLQQAKESVDRLRDAQNQLVREEILKENPVDLDYRKLNRSLVHVPRESDEFELIKKYKENTQGPTHTSHKTEIRNVFKILDNGGISERGSKNVPKKRKKNSMTSTPSPRHLLWHGSRMTNWYSILSQGLRVAPPEAPHTGYMFDKGIYTSDCFSKSAQYCFVSERDSSARGLVVLCEVDLGQSLELTEADYEASRKVSNKDSQYQSVKGVGKWRPDATQNILLKNNDTDSIVPCGKLVDSGPLESTSKTKGKSTTSRSSSRLAANATSSQGLLYNEYIVYDPERVKMKYLVELDFVKS